MPGMVRWIMRIVMAGASGLIGTALSSRLASRRARRRPAGQAAARVAGRDPVGSRQPEPWIRRCLEGADAVINLSGAGIGDRPWTRRRIDELFRSRLDPTRTLAGGDEPPRLAARTFISQSGAGLLRRRRAGRSGKARPPGTASWPASASSGKHAAHEAPAGVRVVTPRTAVVLSRSGGALGRLLPLLRLGIGGPLGNGRQYWPWITLPDLSVRVRIPA